MTEQTRVEALTFTTWELAAIESALRSDKSRDLYDRSSLTAVDALIARIRKARLSLNR